MIARNHVFEIEFIKKAVLPTYRLAHHRPEPLAPSSQARNRDYPSPSKDFYNSLSQEETFDAGDGSRPQHHNRRFGRTDAGSNPGLATILTAISARADFRYGPRRSQPSSAKCTHPFTVNRPSPKSSLGQRTLVISWAADRLRKKMMLLSIGSMALNRTVLWEPSRPLS